MAYCSPTILYLSCEISYYHYTLLKTYPEKIFKKTFTSFRYTDQLDKQIHDKNVFMFLYKNLHM